jgi:hypothetical protein
LGRAVLEHQRKAKNILMRVAGALTQLSTSILDASIKAVTPFTIFILIMCDFTDEFPNGLLDEAPASSASTIPTFPILPKMR